MRGSSSWEEEFLVLQAIYGELFKQVSSDSFHIDIPDRTLSVSFSLSPDYPDSVPKISMTTSSRLDTLSLIKYLLTEAQEMRGEPMIFNLMTLIGDHISDYETVRVVEKEKVEEVTTSYTPIEIRTIEQGTPVTVDSFRKWHAAFLKECDPEALTGDAKTGKLTGRQLFEQKIVRVEEGELAADEADFDMSNVDESLFVGLEDMPSEEEIE
jgi:hypothetical protein